MWDCQSKVVKVTIKSDYQKYLAGQILLLVSLAWFYLLTTGSLLYRTSYSTIKGSLLRASIMANGHSNGNKFFHKKLLLLRYPVIITT